MSPVVQGSVDDFCEESLCPCRGVRKNCASHGCPPTQQSDLDFVFSPAMKGFRRQMLPVSAGSDVCRALNRSSDGRVRNAVHTRARQLVFCCLDSPISFL